MNITSRVKKPTEAEAKALAKYFPSTSAGKKKSRDAFDPVAESIVLPKQKKKKAAISRPRATNITVIMMKEYSPSIPKGKRRQSLATSGRIQTLKFTRTMTQLEVKNQIIRTFKVTTFIVLDCDSTGHTLVKASNQSIDGEGVVGRKGALYLCEKFELVRWYII